MPAFSSRPLLVFAFFLGTLAGLSPIASAQDLPCGTVMPEGYVPPHEANPAAFEEFKRSFQPNRQGKGEGQKATGSCLDSHPLNIYIMRRTNGTGGFTISQLNAAIASMNAIYLAACVEFYVCSTTYIDNDTYYDFNNSDQATIRATYFNGNALNVYFANTVKTTSGNVCGYAYYPNQGNNMVFMANSCAVNGSTLSHELGHAYSLPHTHNGGNELVNGSNCSTAGDKFCDTPADPELGNTNTAVNSSCIYTGTALDANGQAYAPDVTNLMSYSRKSCRTYFSNEQLAAIKFASLTAYDRVNLACTSFSVNFATAQNVICNPTSPGSFSSTSTGATTYDWDFNNDGTTDATTANPSYAFGNTGTFDVALHISNGSKTIRRLKKANVKVGSAAFPYINTIEVQAIGAPSDALPAGWVNDRGSSQITWRRNSGTTPSSGTGPTGGHSNGTGFSGNYFYFEATGSHSAGDASSVITECLQIPSLAAQPNPELSFWYHMYGSGIGSLHVDINTGTGWINDIMPALSGQKQSSSSAAWLERRVALSAYAGQSIQLRFRGKYGTGYQGDIAIDDVQMLSNAAPLPIDLLAFSAKPVDMGNLLSWESASESNAAYFAVERASKSGDFTEIGRVKAKNLPSGASYSYLDQQALVGENYYRLRMIDFDGSFELSKVEVLVVEDSRAMTAINAYPNPTRGIVRVENVPAEAKLSLHNALGQQVDFPGLVAYAPSDFAQGWISVERPTQEINLSALPSGIYWLSIQTAHHPVQSVRIVRE